MGLKRVWLQGEDGQMGMAGDEEVGGQEMMGRDA